MLFNSVEFLFGFLPIALVIFYLLARFASRDSAMYWLVFASLVFYAWWNWHYVFLIIFSIGFNFYFGQLIGRLNLDGRSGLARHAMLLGVAVNLGLLGYFKYADFFISNLNFLFGFGMAEMKIILPIAISFFTFQQIAYLVDAYEGEASRSTFIEYCLFVSFFPQLLAGPIVHHSDVIPQFRERTFGRFNPEMLEEGLTLFFLGMFKKVVLADTFATYSDPVFAAAALEGGVTLFESWVATLSYTLQIYFDFSGYSDMAIGLGLACGIRLPINFDSPYRSKSIIEFWRRWHITLSAFLRDYLYIQLGGNRAGTVRRYLNLMITMLLGGLWHGASWNFVVWGGLHGFYLMVNHLWRHLTAGITLGGRFLRSVAVGAGALLTLASVILAWVFFRAQGFPAAVDMLQGMAGLNGVALPRAFGRYFPQLSDWSLNESASTVFSQSEFAGVLGAVFLLLAGYLVVCFTKNLYEMTDNRRRWLLGLTFAFTMQQIFFGQSEEFIYFQF